MPCSSLQGDDHDALISAALEQAGENRAEIEAALDGAPAEQAEGMKFLVANMPEKDLQSLSAKFLLSNCEFAYRAFNESPWKDRVPPDVFLNYVLPYAAIDEARDEWRQDLYERFKPLVAEAKDPGRASVVLNQKIFPLLKVKFSTARKKANQSAKETMESGIASCSGLSILLIDACRAVGVPARFVGTPLWSDRSGNHSWVEIWDGETWRFTGAAEPAGDELDKGWFNERASTAKRDDLRHAIYAARWERSPQRFPSAWGRRQGQVWAVNVTDRYTKSTKPRAEGEIVIRFRVLDREGGKRVEAEVKLTSAAGGNGGDERVVAEGKSRDDRFDPNDHLEAVVKRGEPLTASIQAGERKIEETITPEKEQELFTYYLVAAAQDSTASGSGESTTSSVRPTYRPPVRKPLGSP